MIDIFYHIFDIYAINALSFDLLRASLNWSKSFLDFLDSSGRIIHAVLHDVSRYDMLGNRYGGLQIN